MVKYSMEATESLLNQIEKVQGRPQSTSLYKMAQQLADKIRKVDHPIYPDNENYGYMMAVHDFRLFNTVPWQDTFNVGTFFKVPATAITDTDQKSEE